MKALCLQDIPVGGTASVANLLTNGSIRRRLLDMGITAGTIATCVFESPFGDPRAYYIRGALIALREEDAACIQVTAG